MIRLIALLLVGCQFANATENDELVIAPCKAFSIRGGKVELMWTGKPRENPSTFITDFEKPCAIPHGGKYDVYFTPKDGLKIHVLPDWSPKAGKNTLQLAAHLGTAVVFGDNLPRVEWIVLTEETDPGPGEKAHRPIQRVSDYKDVLIVPPGFYSVWIVPANGAKPQRIEDRIRVQTGRETRVGE